MHPSGIVASGLLPLPSNPEQALLPFLCRLKQPLVEGKKKT
jgi:hypothetical protein